MKLFQQLLAIPLNEQIALGSRQYQHEQLFSVITRNHYIWFMIFISFSWTEDSRWDLKASRHIQGRGIKDCFFSFIKPRTGLKVDSNSKFWKHFLPSLHCIFTQNITLSCLCGGFLKRFHCSVLKVKKKLNNNCWKVLHEHWHIGIT